MENSCEIWWEGKWTWLPAPDDDLKKAFGSIPVYYCPSKGRSTPAILQTVTETTNGRASGPQIDYAMVFHVRVHDAGSSQGWMFCSEQGRSTDYSNHVGPFRMAIVEGPTAISVAGWNAWKPRDTFAWLSDGTSNQFMIGEKHIPTNRMGLCDGSAPGATIPAEVFSGDCSYLSPGVWGINSMGRAFRTWGGELTLAKGPSAFSEDTYVPTHHYNFGSAHTGVCNFVIGDGSVQAVSVTTPHSVLASFAQVNDGKAVSLP